MAAYRCSARRLHSPRLAGLEPITIAYGQTLVFKYSAHHDVWQHPSAESLTACRYSDAVMLADTSQGGGCELDEDLGESSADGHADGR